MSIDINHLHVVILAGGEGTRFAPISTSECPKQFLKITDSKKSMIRQTFERVASLVPANQIWVSTNEKYVPLVKQELPEVSPNNIVGEPLKKNTAPAIALLTKIIGLQDPKAVVLFCPSDHFVKNIPQAHLCWKKAADMASLGRSLVVFGVPPHFPSSDYGYLHIDREESSVIQFVEKPDRKTAEVYLKDGNYLWNSGMFVWRVDYFMAELKRSLGEIFLLLERRTPGSVSAQSLHEYFERVPSISIDYGLMEKASNISFVSFDAGWSDVGTWEGLASLALAESLRLDPAIEKILDEKHLLGVS